MLKILVSSFAVVSAFQTPMTARYQSSRAQSPCMMAKGIPNKNVWVPIVSAADVKPGTITSGFKYGQEIAVVCDPKGTVAGMTNKMPPFGQPTNFATFDSPGTITDPVTQSKFSIRSGKQVGTWCPSPLGRLIFSRLTKPTNMETYPVRRSGGVYEALINVNAKAQFEQKYWRGILDAQGKVDGGYY